MVLIQRKLTMAMTLRIVIPPHPLIGHWLTILRTNTTPQAIYETAFFQIGKWLTYEALREWIPNTSTEIQCDKGTTQGTLIESSIKINVIAQSAGGLELWLGAREILPNAKLILGPFSENIESNSGVIIFLDQITNGEQLISVLNSLNEQNVTAERLRVITVIASSKGLKNLGEKYPDLTIHAACIDEELTSNNEIVPGIGNPTARLNTRINYHLKH